MSVKVEMQVTEGQVALAFECSREEDHPTLDAIRVAFFGDHDKRGGYVNSNRFVIHVKDETVTTEKETP